VCSLALAWKWRKTTIIHVPDKMICDELSSLDQFIIRSKTFNSAKCRAAHCLRPCITNQHLIVTDYLPFSPSCKYSSPLCWHWPAALINCCLVSIHCHQSINYPLSLIRQIPMHPIPVILNGANGQTITSLIPLSPSDPYVYLYNSARMKKGPFLSRDCNISVYNPMF